MNYKRQPRAGMCVHADCSNGQYARGRCKYHYNLDREHGLFGHPTCPEDGCDRAATVSGRCRLHHERFIGGREMGAPLRKTDSDGWGSWYVEKSSGYVQRARRGVGRKSHERQYQHRVVMAEHIGRPLTREETVHHVNGDRSDNRLENLELWSSSQPAGQRVADKVAWAREILSRYGESDV